MITYKFNTRRCIFTGMTSDKISFLSSLNMIDKIEIEGDKTTVWFKPDLQWNIVADLVHLMAQL